MVLLKNSRKTHLVGWGYLTMSTAYLKRKKSFGNFRRSLMEQNEWVKEPLCETIIMKHKSSHCILWWRCRGWKSYRCCHFLGLSHFMLNRHLIPLSYIMIIIIVTWNKIKDFKVKNLLKPLKNFRKRFIILVISIYAINLYSLVR